MIDARFTENIILISDFVVVPGHSQKCCRNLDFLSQFAEQKGQKRSACIKRYM